MAEEQRPRDATGDFVEWVEKRWRKLLLSRIARRIAPWANRQDAEDQLQDLYVALLRYRVNPGEIKNAEAYLTSMIGHAAAASNESRLQREGAERKAEGRTHHEDGVDDLVNEDVVRSVLSELSKRDQDIVAMHIFEGMSAAEIAERFPGTSEHKVRRYLTELKKHIRELWVRRNAGKGT